MAHIGNACYGCWMVHTCSRTSVLGEVTNACYGCWMVHTCSRTSVLGEVTNACYGCWMVHTCSRTSVLGEVTCLTSSCVTSWKDFFCAVSMSSSASSAGRMRAHRTSICSRLALAMSTAPLDTWSAAASRNHKIKTEYYLTRIYILLFEIIKDMTID